MRIIRPRLIKGDIPRNPHSTSNRVIAVITLMFRTVPKEDTLNRLSSDFGALMRWKKDVTDTQSNKDGYRKEGCQRNS
jgi:hypothetical protein